ncbi:hypothetical protein ACWEOW_08120 [Monashia sp. NPDC004114]
MTDHDEAAADGPDRGRLVVVTGSPEPVRTRLAGELARRFEHGVLVDGTTFDAMVVSGRTSSTGPPGLDELRLRMLRFSAAIATAETFQLDGFDVVVTDDLLGDRLEEFLDLAAPEPVHVVVLDDGMGEPTPRWGLWLGGMSGDTPVPETVDLLLSELADALVRTVGDAE